MANFLSPMFNEQTFTANGDPAVGYKINTYNAGTSTPLQTYTTKTGTTQQANPIILNSRGAPDDVIWLAQGSSYKFVLTDSNDVVIDTFDNISGINDTSVSSSGEWSASGYTPTYIGATSFSVVGDKTTDFLVGRRIRSTNTGGTTYSLITVSSYNSGTGLTTVTVTNDSGTLDAGLSAVDLAILTPTNPSLPNSNAARVALGIDIEGAAVASAATIDIWATDGNTRHITGSTGPITSMGTAPQAGAWMKLIFDSTPTLTQGTNLNLNGGGSNIAIEAGDVAFVYADTTTQLDVFVIRKSGAAIVPTTLSTSADVIAGISGTTAMTPSAYRAGAIVNGGYVATTSGTSKEWTTIPSWAKRVKVQFVNTSLDAATDFRIVIGLTTYTATGYESVTTVPGVINTTSTAGFIVRGQAAGNLSGTLIIERFSNTSYWVCSYALSDYGAGVAISGGGRVDVGGSGTIDRLQVTSISGTANFDAGFLNVTWE